jgi:hypothetical protein
MKSPRQLTSFLLALVALAVVPILASGACAAGKPSAADLFVATNGSDSGRCTRNAPCASMLRAYTVAKAGNVVEIASGTYGDQEISGSRNRTGDPVVFRPAAGATVALGGILFDNASRAELRDLRMSHWYMRYSSNVVFANVTTRFFFIRSSDHISILGGSVGGIQDGTSPTIGNFAGKPPSSEILVDGVLFHDVGRQENRAAHIECLFLQEAVGVVIRNSRFTRCEVMDLYVSPVQGGPTASNVLIENNWFDVPTGGGYFVMELHPDAGTVPHNFNFRFNSVNGSIYIYPEFDYDKVVFDSNIGRIATCDTKGITYRYNVWTNQKCGPTDRQAPLQFVNAGNFDLHLKPDSVAVGAGHPNVRPARDIEGDVRPARMRPDAGADQRDPASIVPGKSIGAIKLGDSDEQVSAFYGPGRRGARETVSYTLHGGKLTATYANGRVVRVATTSRFYTTAAGLGVGSKLSAARSVRKTACKKLFQTRVGSAALYLGARGKGASAKIGTVSIAAGGHVC